MSKNESSLTLSLNDAQLETKWLPAWRHAREAITLVEHPSKEWFYERHHTRFAVLVDGSIIWGDGEESIHGDLTRAAKSIGRPVALCAGVVQRSASKHPKAPWFACSLEMSPLARDDKSEALVMLLLSNLITWHADTRALGEVTRFDAAKMEDQQLMNVGRAR